MNVKNILVPIDYSHSGDAAMAYAVSLAKEYGALLHLVHVHEETMAFVDGGFATTTPPIPEPVDLEAEQAKLDAITPGGDVKIHREVIVGNPGDELVKYAKAKDVDMVVMGTHGRTGLNRLLMGSVAEGVVRRSPCPVLTIKQPANESQADN